MIQVVLPCNIISACGCHTQLRDTCEPGHMPCGALKRGMVVNRVHVLQLRIITQSILKESAKLKNDLCLAYQNYLMMFLASTTWHSTSGPQLAETIVHESQLQALTQGTCTVMKGKLLLYIPQWLQNFQPAITSKVAVVGITVAKPCQTYKTSATTSLNRTEEHTFTCRVSQVCLFFLTTIL